MKKEHRAILIIAFTILLFIPLTQAGFWQWLTGQATSGPTNVSVTLGNNAPNITYVNVSYTVTPNEDNYLELSVSFTGYDPDGEANLDDTTPEGNVTILAGGSEIRSNSSCEYVANIDANSNNYSCFFDMWYFDTPGYWNITVSMADINGVWTTNTTKFFNYETLTSMVVGPQTITWGSVTAGATNQTPTNYNMINNTGNDGVNNVQVRAIDLIGVSDQSYHLNAENFTSSNSTGSDIECDYSQASYVTVLLNNTYRQVPGAYLYRGNNSWNNGTGQEDIYYCLVNVSSSQYSQSYTTGYGGPWYLQIVT